MHSIQFFGDRPCNKTPARRAPKYTIRNRALLREIAPYSYKNRQKSPAHLDGWSMYSSCSKARRLVAADARNIARRPLTINRARYNFVAIDSVRRSFTRIAKNSSASTL